MKRMPVRMAVLGAALAGALVILWTPAARADEPADPGMGDPEPEPEEPAAEPVDPLGGGDPAPGEPSDEPAEPPKPEKPRPPPAVEPGTEVPPEEMPPDEVPTDGEPVDEEALAAEAEEKRLAELKRVEQEMKARAADFLKVMRSGSTTDQQKEKAIVEISVHKHPAIAEALIPFMKADVSPPVVRETAIAALKSQKFGLVAEAALKNFNAKSDDLKYNRAMLEVVTRTADAKQIPKLKAIMRDETINQEYCKCAVQAMGAIGHRDAISDLILLFQKLSAPSWPATKAARKQALLKPVEQALKDITKVEMPSADMWKMWWKENERTFQKE